MTHPQPELTPDDWHRICDALRYLGRDLHHRSFAVSAEQCLGGPCRSGGLNPVRQGQSLHPGEFTCVVGDQRALLADCMGRDHRVQRSDRAAPAFQFGPQVAIHPERRFIKGKNHKRSQEHLQGLPVAGRSAFGDAIGQFGGDHAADPDLPHPVLPEFLQNRLRSGVDHMNADDGLDLHRDPGFPGRHADFDLFS